MTLLTIGVSNNDLGVHINIIQPLPDGSAAIIYSAQAPKGDSFGTFNTVDSTSETAQADDDCYCGGFGDVHQTNCPKAHAQQDAAPTGEICKHCGSIRPYHELNCVVVGARIPDSAPSAATGKAAAANAGGQAPILANGLPVEQTQFDWVARAISEHSIFDGDDILRAWNELVAFYVAYRSRSHCGQPEKGINHE